jgi:hypothetical protein
VPIIITNIFDQHEASRVISILATDLKARMSTEDIVNPHQPGNRRFLPCLTKEFIELYNKYECALEIVRRTHLDKNHVKASGFRNIELIEWVSPFCASEDLNKLQKNSGGP